MNREARIKKIQEIVDREKNKPFGMQEIPWKDNLVSMGAYKIPLEYLVYNKYNGRILSRTKSLEKQGREIDVTAPDGKKLIEKLLWDSKIDRNKKTLINIKDFGQQKVGVITKDGIIIDGNRRVMLLNKIEKYSYFKAVVLPVTLEENPIEIEELETKFQMGEDEKLGYNATEKYLKAKELYLRLTNKREVDLQNLNKNAVSKISNWMGESKKEIEKYLSAMVIMDDYLEHFDYDGIYTQLDGREDQFLFLTKWLNTFYNSDSKKGFDGYENSDVDDLKVIAFDYIRIRKEYDGKEFRSLAEGNREKHFFGDKAIWNSFSNKHFDILKHLPGEAEIDFNSNNLEDHLNARDNIFYNSSKDENGESAFLENLDEHKYLIGYNKAAGEPEKLVKRASKTFEAIKTGHSSFATPEVQTLVEELGEKVFDALLENSPSKILAHIIKLLEKIDSNKIPEPEIDDVLEKTKRIQQLGYRINKEL